MNRHNIGHPTWCGYCRGWAARPNIQSGGFFDSQSCGRGKDGLRFTPTELRFGLKIGTGPLF